MTDEVRCEGLRATIRVRLEACDESELDALERMLSAIEDRREILPPEKRTAWPPKMSPPAKDSLRRAIRARGEEITAALRELRDATPIVPRRPFEVLNGGLKGDE